MSTSPSCSWVFAAFTEVNHSTGMVLTISFSCFLSFVFTVLAVNPDNGGGGTKHKTNAAELKSSNETWRYLFLCLYTVPIPTASRPTQHQEPVCNCVTIMCIEANLSKRQFHIIGLISDSHHCSFSYNKSAWTVMRLLPGVLSFVCRDSGWKQRSIEGYNVVVKHSSEPWMMWMGESLIVWM